MDKKFLFELITPSQTLVSNNFDMVVVPGKERDFGVLENHSNFISQIRPGILQTYNNNKVDREFLVYDGVAEVTSETFQFLDDYLSRVLSNSISCLDSSITPGRSSSGRTSSAATVDSGMPGVCRMTLLDPGTGEVQPRTGLNWGQAADTSHVNPDDASIPIRAPYIRAYPEIFPKKQESPSLTKGEGRPQRNNDPVDMLWDDGVTMKGLMEGSQPIDGIRYPKQFCTFPQKKDLGIYIRNRVGVPLGTPVTRVQLDAYGRTHIDVSLIGEGICSFDFSV